MGTLVLSDRDFYDKTTFTQKETTSDIELGCWRQFIPLASSADRRENLEAKLLSLRAAEANWNEAFELSNLRGEFCSKITSPLLCQRCSLLAE